MIAVSVVAGGKDIRYPLSPAWEIAALACDLGVFKSESIFTTSLFVAYGFLVVSLT